MAFCSNCGSSIPEGAAFCISCGNKATQAVASPLQFAAAAAAGGSLPIPPPPRPSPAGAGIVDVQAFQSPTWYVTFATGQTGGPFTEDEVRAMIARQQIKVTDSVVAQGGTAWVPITQSPFARFVVSQASMDRLASSTCPQCGSAMAVVVRTSGAAKAFYILGFLTIWMFGFGVIFLIIGYIVGRNPSPGYECPRCKYKAR